MDKQQAKDRRKYLKHRDKILARQRAYRETSRGRAIEMWHSHRRTAKKRGLEASLSMDWFEGRLNFGVCELTGLEFDMTCGKSAYSPSVDRINNDKGYTEDNCRLILWALNAAFGTWGSEVFENIWEEIGP